MSIIAALPLRVKRSTALSLIDDISRFSLYLFAFFETNLFLTSGLHDVLDCIEPMKTVFPILNECIHIALTIGTSQPRLSEASPVFDGSKLTSVVDNDPTKTKWFSYFIYRERHIL